MKTYSVSRYRWVDFTQYKCWGVVSRSLFTDHLCLPDKHVTNLLRWFWSASFGIALWCQYWGRGLGAHKVLDYQNNVDFIANHDFFVSVAWFDYRIPSKSRLNWCITTYKIVKYQIVKFSCLEVALWKVESRSKLNWGRKKV